MKATDLMIGDYVFWDWVTHKVDYDGDVVTDKGYEVSRRIIKVSSVNEGGVTFKSLKDKSRIYLEEEELAPIPLTPEILEKNGFEKVELESNTYRLLSFRDDVWFSINDYFYLGFDETAVQFNCYSVHELQHILKFNGVNKEILL
jgi:hypothetical protein